MVKKNLIALGVVLGLGCFASAPASAGAVVCVAEAVDVAVSTTGAVHAVLTGDWGSKTWSFCNVNSQVGSISPTTCKAISSTLTVGLASGLKLKMTLDDTFVASCSDVSTQYTGWVPFYTIGAVIKVTRTPID